jgi:hypothetical protein
MVLRVCRGTINHHQLMPYEIIIKQRRVETKTIGKEWKKVATKEVERDSRWTDSPDAPKTRIEDVMGYTPETEAKVEIERVVLTQHVDELDLGAVIKAINKL